MFIPVMEETDIFNEHGIRVDDINSVYEFVDQVVLGHKDDTPEDEDDDGAHYFNVAHIKAFVVPRFVLAQVKQPVLIQWVEKPDYVLLPEHSRMSVTGDITVPPPRA